MAGTTVESLFGINAGIVWKALNQNGPSNILNLVKATSLSREEIYGALGWLGREDKLVIEQKGRAMVFSLRDEEACLVVPEEATAKEPNAKAQLKFYTNKQQRKAPKARMVKMPVMPTERTPGKKDRVDEFLLH